MRIRKSDKFFYGGLSFLLGVATAELLHWPVYLEIIVLATLIFIYFFFKKRTLVVFVFLFCFGLFWNSLLLPNISEDHISFYNDQFLEFQAVITEEPDIRLDHQKLTVEPIKYDGRVLVKLFLYPEYSYGDILNIKCNLVLPEPIEEFNYDKYLAKSNIYSICYYSQVSIIDKGGGNLMKSIILRIKSSMELKINKMVHEPQAALTAGILIGSRQGIPRDLLNKFNETGITHIIAISGYNITIIVTLILNLAKHLYVNRKKAIWVIIVCLVFFVILTGASASVVRAAIMGFIVVLAKHLGRRGHVKNVLVLSAVIMILINPKILIWDAGFQLSFLSTIGLIYFSPIVIKNLIWLPEKFAIRENASSTLSAIVFTLPLILFNFGRLSLVAPIVNLLVLPIIPIAMLVGFIQVLFSYFLPIIDQIVAWFSWVLLKYVIVIVEIFSSFKFSSLEINVSWLIMLLAYMILFIFVIKKNRTARC